MRAISRFLRKLGTRKINAQIYEPNEELNYKNIFIMNARSRRDLNS